MRALIIPFVGDPWFEVVADQVFGANVVKHDQEDWLLMLPVSAVRYHWTGQIARKNGDVLFDVFEEASA